MHNQPTLDGGYVESQPDAVVSPLDALSEAGREVMGELNLHYPIANFIAVQEEGVVQLMQEGDATGVDWAILFKDSEVQDPVIEDWLGNHVVAKAVRAGMWVPIAGRPADSPTWRRKFSDSGYIDVERADGQTYYLPTAKFAAFVWGRSGLEPKEQ